MFCGYNISCGYRLGFMDGYRLGFMECFVAIMLVIVVIY